MLRLIILCACAFSGYPMLVSAATVEYLSPEQLKDRSELVFIGSVARIDVGLETNPTRVWTTVSFDVSRVLKGESGRSTTLRQLGGTVSTEAGPITQKIHGYPDFKVGERVLMFLERADTGVRVVTGLAQGKFTLSDGVEPSEIRVTRSLKDIRHPRPLAPVRTVAGQPRPGGPLFLDQLLAQIAGRTPIARPIRLQLQTPVNLPTPTHPEGGLR